jgi:hypothetical protein
MTRVTILSRRGSRGSGSRVTSSAVHAGPLPTPNVVPIRERLP